MLTAKVNELNTEMTTISKQVQLTLAHTLYLTQKLSKPDDATVSVSDLQATVVDDYEPPTGISGEYTLDSSSMRRNDDDD